MPTAMRPVTNAKPCCSLLALNRLATNRPASMPLSAPAAKGSATGQLMCLEIAVAMTPYADTSAMTASDVAMIAGTGALVLPSAQGR